MSWPQLKAREEQHARECREHKRLSTLREKLNKKHQSACNKLPTNPTTTTRRLDETTTASGQTTNNLEVTGRRA